MSVDEQLRDKIERISNLPTLPEVASRLMKAVNDPSSSASDIGRIVGQDVSLSAKIIRLANSAFYGMPRSVTNVNTAVVILGFKVISTMVLSLTVFDMFPPGRHATPFDRKAFWRHCLRCGLLARLLAKKTQNSRIDPDDAFCAGLLHDIGKVVMEQYLHDDFHTALEHAKENELSFFEAENTVLGYTHAEVAEWLTSHWELPDSLYYPIVSHHSPLEASECKEIVYVCHCADFYSYDWEITGENEGRPPPLEPSIQGILGIESAHLEEIKAAFGDELDKMEFFQDLIEGKK